MCTSIMEQHLSINDVLQVMSLIAQDKALLVHLYLSEPRVQSDARMMGINAFLGHEALFIGYISMYRQMPPARTDW